VSKFQQLKELFWQNPFRNSVTLLTLWVAVSSFVLLAAYKQHPLMIVAFAHMLPLVVILTDSVRDKMAGKLPRWPTWLVAIVYSFVLVGSMGLALFIYLDFEAANLIFSVTYALSSLVIFIVLLPRLLSYVIEKLASNRYVGKYINKIDTPENLYILPVFASTVIYTIYQYPTMNIDDNFIFYSSLTIILIILFSPPFIWGKFLWKENNDSLFALSLPHLPLWQTLNLTALISINEHLLDIYDYINRDFLFGTSIFILLFYLLAIICWTLQILKAYTVEPLTQPYSERPDSIQSEVSDFIDVHNHSSRLIRSISRSDAGVFGVTGVRGAGKSALTRHVLYQ